MLLKTKFKAKRGAINFFSAFPTILSHLILFIENFNIYVIRNLTNGLFFQLQISAYINLTEK